ncbi:hypothetical protein MKB79_004339, partial [Salmonella enterica]|nr:hypothetical protein [Salmonella enterica]
MSLEKYLDSGRLNFVDVFMRTARNFGDLQFNYKRDLGNELKKDINRISRGHLKSILQKMRKDKPSKDDADFEEQTLAKVFFILEAHDFTTLAEDMALVIERRNIKERCQKIIYKEIAEGSAFKQRSIAASGPRHRLYDEIVAIMKSTWKHNPALSKRKMISKLLIRYEDKVDEKTLRDWITKGKLAPPRPRQNKNSDLVIPPEYASKKIFEGGGEV